VNDYDAEDRSKGGNCQAIFRTNLLLPIPKICFNLYFSTWHKQSMENAARSCRSSADILTFMDKIVSGIGISNISEDF